MRLRSRPAAAGLGGRPTGAEAFADWESLLESGEPEAVLVLHAARGSTAR